MQSRTGGLPRWSMGRDSGQRARRGGGPERESDDESKSDDELKRETLVLTQNTAMRHRRGVFNRRLGRLELIRLHYFYSESTIVPEPGGSTRAVTVPFWIGIATGGSLPVQHVTAD